MQISKKPFKVLFSLYLKDNNSGPLSSNYVLLRCFYFALKRKKNGIEGRMTSATDWFSSDAIFWNQAKFRVIDTRKNKSNRDHWAKLFAFTI